MPLLMVFLDGVGVGAPGPHNPFSVAPSSLFRPLGRRGEGELPRGGTVALADATLGVEGLPQSATGGAALFTGENAAARLGCHLQGFPNAALRSLIAGRGLLGRARALGARVAFANAYTPAFFESSPPPESVHRPGGGPDAGGPGPPGRALAHRPHSVTTVATLSAGLSLKTLGDLRRGEALHRDFTNALLLAQGHAVELRSPQEAGGVLARLAEGHDLLLYEYFQTDLVGHRQDMEEARREVEKLDGFLLAALESLDLARHTFLVTSDHGNFEDLSVRTHTRNPVPALLWGRWARALGGKIRSITDVTPSLLEVLREELGP